jgi:AcrR family transcriptional regulator
MNFDSQPISRLRTRLREETAIVILNAAEAVIGEDGLHGARMETIASRAGVSVGTLYNHFEDRDALIEALRTSRAGFLRELVDRAEAASAGEPPRAQILALFRAMVAHASAHGPFFAALMSEHQGPSQLRPPAQARAELMRHAEAFVARGIASGHVRAGSPAVFAEALTALARLVLARAIEGSADDALLEALVDLYLRGVAP